MAADTPVLVHNCNVALGKKATGTYGWASANKFDHFGGYSDTDWMEPAQNAIRDRNVNLHVNLDGIGSFVDSAKAGLAGKGGSTDIEMGWIARAIASGDRDWSSVTFYRRVMGKDGKYTFHTVAVDEPDWAQEFGRVRPFFGDTKPYCRCNG